MKNILSFFGLLSFSLATAQITLTHNVGNIPVKTDMFSCEFAQSWARSFELSDFGIPITNKFVINSGQVAIYNSLGGASLQFHIYKIDNNFPTSYSITDLIGSSQIIKAPIIGEDPEIININFDTPVIVPDGVDRILVEVRKFYDINKHDESIAYIAGTNQDNDISWFWGCHNVYSHTPTEDLIPPSYDANFYINVTGELINTDNLGLDTTLTHNLCNEAVWVNQYSCSWGGLKYARTFTLEDFGISNNEEFVIDSGQVAFSSVGVYDVKIQFNIYKIDDNFPASYSETDLIGSSQVINVPYFGSGNRRDAKIFDVFFGTPIVVPSDVDKILVEVFNLNSSSSAGLAFIGGGIDNNDISWLRSEASGCPPFREYRAITAPDVNYFIKVKGNTRHVTNNFEMNISNICSEFLKEFSVENKDDVASVVWDFGDPASGVDNSSTDMSPFHDFSQDGTYTITATVTGKDGSVNVLTETIDVTEPPQAYGITNIYACEDNFNTGISSSFNTSNLLQQVLGGQTNKVVTFIDGSGVEYDVLPNPFTNTVIGTETITVRVAHDNNLCCYSETTFDLIVNTLPNITSVDDLIVCENNTSGYAFFNLEMVKEGIINNATNLSVLFYNENGNEIQEPLNAVENEILNEEEITVRVTNTDTNCYNVTTFKLKVNPLPVANSLSELIGCDDNDDGISEYFDTSSVEAEVLGSQTGMEVTYFDTSGNILSNPLPNPYTNLTQNQEEIIVRVTNPATSCYAETLLVLKTSAKPKINTPQTLYACNLGDGFAQFNTSNIEEDIIGNQNGLRILFFDTNGNTIESPLPLTYQNTQAWSQTINVRVENELNSSCYSETTFDLIVNDLPMVTIEDSYFLCDLEPFYNLTVDNSFDLYLWQHQDGSTISNTSTVSLEKSGSYSLTIGKNENGIYCENSFDFELIRSQLPTIIDVKINELSDENYIEVFVSGDGDFEYSIDGENYQNNNMFNNLLGGIYTVIVRDKLGCGEDSKEVTLIDYPKYFTPNNDGVNDFWHIKGVKNFPEATVMIYDRYGKLIKQISSKSNGWDGTFNGKELLSSDYWFTAKLDSETLFTGHFSLKR